MRVTASRPRNAGGSVNRLVVVGLALIGLVAAAAPAAGQADSGPHVTFSKDVAPILQRSCENCHRDGGGAPMSLVTYSEVRPWARAIKGAHRGARDAAVVHRQEHRHPAIQGRTRR